jgi:hypothetical protein
MSFEEVVLTIPVLRTKELKTIVTFKNAPDNFIVTPLKFVVSPETDLFNISVDDYEKTVDYSVGVIDFKTLSPSNHVFTFFAENTNISEESSTQEFNVNVDMTGIKQEYLNYSRDKIKINNPDGKDYIVSSLNKSIVVVGNEKDLETVTEDNIKVEVDLSEVDISKGQTVTVPANVTVDNAGCWIYGTYFVEVSL